MWSEICELIPLTTGLDSCIEHDIAEVETELDDDVAFRKFDKLNK